MQSLIDGNPFPIAGVTQTRLVVSELSPLSKGPCSNLRTLPIRGGNRNFYFPQDTGDPRLFGVDCRSVLCPGSRDIDVPWLKMGSVDSNLFLGWRSTLVSVGGVATVVELTSDHSGTRLSNRCGMDLKTGHLDTRLCTHNKIRLRKHY